LTCVYLSFFKIDTFDVPVVPEIFAGGAGSQGIDYGDG